MNIAENAQALAAAIRERDAAIQEFYKQLGKRLRELREAKGLRQEDLTPFVRMSRTSITNIESGKQRVLSHDLFFFAAAFDVEPIELLPKEVAA